MARQLTVRLVERFIADVAELRRLQQVTPRPMNRLQMKVLTEAEKRVDDALELLAIDDQADVLLQDPPAPEHHVGG